MFDCYDHNFFASRFHIDMFIESFKEYGNYVGLTTEKNKVQRVGWPMEYLKNSLDSYKGMPKENIILFPHRIAPEKQPDLFRDLQHDLPDYELIVCADKTLTKNEYHNLLGRAKMVFSANLQETLGISWYEGALVDCIPMVPDRLSYSEMAIDQFKYPSVWTIDADGYAKHKAELVERIKTYMEHYNEYLPIVRQQVKKLQTEFFSGNELYGAISSER